MVTRTLASAEAWPSEAAYVNVVEPAWAADTPLICRARPPRATVTTPHSGCLTGAAVSTSPSRSESLSSTGRMVERPGRMPNSSSSASGGVFSSRCWGSATSFVSSGLSCSSSFSSSSFSTSSQLSMRTMFESGSQTLPSATSLRTMALRFVRKTISRAVVSVSTTICLFAEGSSQARMYAPLPVHAPYAQPSWRTGAAGVPLTPPSVEGVIVGVPPTSGIDTREVGVASRTESAFGPACWRTPPASTPSALRSIRLLSGRKSVLDSASRATTWSPTTVMLSRASSGIPSTVDVCA